MMPSRMDLGNENQYLSRSYADAVHEAGGAPVMLPLLQDPGALIHLAKMADGILLTGSGSDVDPVRYGAVRKPECGPVQPLRDETDFRLLDVAFEQQTPILCICFGMQSLNVYLGGTLIQDIPSERKSPIIHNNPESRGEPTHEIEIAAGTVLARIAGGVRGRVNSTHHQALDRVGQGLEVVARAPDGIIEAVAGTSGRPVLGLQWHPEKSVSFDDFSRRIFQHFLAECRRRWKDE